jgi:Subtilase family
MTDGDRLPLLLFQEPVPATKPSGNFGRPRFNPRSRQEVAGYLEPKLSRLQQALEAERIRIQASATGIEPELALVIELAADLGNFAAAARVIGLEWLAEDEIEIQPTEAIFLLSPKGEREGKPYLGRFFLTMTDRRALDELLSRWRQWRDDPDKPWPLGETAWRDLFPLIVDVRPWGMEDRLQETGMLEDLAERIEAGEDRIPFEAELWYRHSAERRALAENQLEWAIRDLGGHIKTCFQLADIRYHAILGEIPAGAVPALLTRNPNIDLLRCNDVWLFRPVGQCAAPLILTSEPGETAVPPQTVLDPALQPIVALLDGVPLAGHDLLKDRLVIDDPDGFEADAPVQQRVHGTSMASLIVHGDIEAAESPLSRRVYCRPIMVPQVTALHSQEHIPDSVLPVDLVHRAVRRLFEGEGQTEAQAPEARIVNLSVGDPSRPFIHTLSPWARLLDWLSYKYGVLFIVSAGNHALPLDLDVPKEEWSGMDGPSREAMILRALKETTRTRRILSPAESLNALTIGAAHADACSQGPVAGYHCDPLTLPSLASPISANGLGLHRALKPDILLPGGRQIYEEAVGTGLPNARLSPLRTLGPPGQKTAVPGSVPGESGKTLWLRGTSNAAALATRLGAQLFDVLETLRSRADGSELPAQYDTVLIKALLVHGACWSKGGERLRTLFKSEVGGHKIKDLVGRFLGYGLVDPDRVLGCTDRRATLLGFGTLAKGEAHAFRLPLPPDLSGRGGLRRLTITLGWISPIAPSQQRYRKAHLWFSPDGIELIGVKRGDNSSDHNLVKRGTVQHESFEGEKASAFADGDAVRIQVNCREDAPSLDETVDYGLVVSLEVGEGIFVPIYEQIRQRLRVGVPIPT